MKSLARRWTATRVFTIAAFACGASSAAQAIAVPTFPALERPAVRVRSPERSVLLAAAVAGRRAIAVGERGVVTLSDDGGATWRQAKSVPVAVTLTAVQFIDAQRGWAVGHGGVVLQSVDAGETWRKLVDGRQLAAAALEEARERTRGGGADASAKAALSAAETLVVEGPDKPLFDVHFVDARHGWVVGAYNLFFETTDGGVTWRSLMGRLDNPGARHLYSMAVQGDTLYIAGEQGVLFRSVDRGLSFGTLASSYKGSWFKLVLLDDDKLIVAGLRGNAMFSADRGRSWSRIEGAPPVTFVTGMALPDGTALLCNQAGQLLQSREGASLSPYPTAPLTLPAGVIPVTLDSLLVVGMTGAARVPIAR